MSSDVLRDHLSGSYGPIKEGERQPAPVVQPVETARSEPRFVSAPKREWVSTGMTLGGKPVKNTVGGGYGSHEKKQSSTASSPPVGGAGSEGAPAAEEHVSATSAAEETPQEPFDLAQWSEEANADSAIRAELEPLAQPLHAAMAEINEAETTMPAMVGWLTAFSEGRTPPAVQHGYDVTKWQRVIPAKDWATFQSFAGALWSAGASESALDAMVRTFRDIQDARHHGKLRRASTSYTDRLMKHERSE